MGEDLIDLDKVLRSKQNPKLTSQEANVLLQCKLNALKDFAIGTGVGGIVAWLATWKFSNLSRVKIAGGIAIISGKWRLDKYQNSNSFHEYILGLEGTRIQRELATIMLTKRRDDPMTIRLVSKHFYSEKVFDESSSDQPRLRWRYRNSSGDNLVHSARTQQTESYGEQTPTSSKNTNFDPKQVSVKGGVADVLSNPFDSVFGPQTIRTAEIQPPTSTPSKRHRRSHKRSHRRHRMRHREDSSDI